MCFVSDGRLSIGIRNSAWMLGVRILSRFYLIRCANWEGDHSCRPGMTELSIPVKRLT